MGPEAHDTDILELDVIVNTHDDLLAPEGKVSEYIRAGSAAPKLRRYLRVHVGARMVRFDRVTTSLNTLLPFPPCPALPSCPFSSQLSTGRINLAHPQPHMGSSQAAHDCHIIDGATLPIFDVFIIGIPTSCGDFSDWKAFRDSNGPTPTALLLAPRGLAHHDIIFLPRRCASTLDQLTVPLVAVIYMPVRLEFPIVLYPSLVFRSPSP
ncbi:hypothetical protein B0H14DRAFT_3165557 [Mycena olivaceomarginata]|nr:hypothetical protein B0H14DRAFT_3165557 [Mycena olivaceomarginata]